MAAIGQNLGVARQRAGGADIIAVVKADAYGHGLEKVGGFLADKVEFLAVAALREAASLDPFIRGKRSKLMVLGPCLPEEFPQVISQGWRPSLSTLEEVEAARATAHALGLRAPVHLVVDTGMGRMGCVESDFQELWQRASSHPELEIEGVASHLPSADEDRIFTETQLRRFEDLIRQLPSEVPVHILNSAGLLGYVPRGTWARPGLMLYGISPQPEFQDGLVEAMQLKTRVRLVREMPAGHGISYGRTFLTEHPTTVATLGIGYGDGYSRALSNRGAHVLISGQRCPVLGRVSMDQLMVDVSHLPKPPRPGDEAVLFGRQGEARLSLREIAEWAKTIPWEILTGITKRVPRVYT